jgi:hypothetical protein
MAEEFTENASTVRLPLDMPNDSEQTHSQILQDSEEEILHATQVDAPEIAEPQIQAKNKKMLAPVLGKTPRPTPTGL